MKKGILSISLMGLLAGTASAGTMGDASFVNKDYFVPFVMGEGTVTWNSTKSVTIFGNQPSISKQLWGGRGAVGVVHTSISRFGYTTEMGWGYYGSTSSRNSGSSAAGSLAITNDSYLYGFDLLAGLTYDFAPLQVYLKAGAMAENRHTKAYAQFGNTNPINGTNYLSTNQLRSTATNVLPEIKVGGLYAINEHLGLSLAYMHVFGNDNFAATVNGSFASPGAASGISSVANAQNPSLNSILFGLVYHFA
jgi:hypothetical protein